MKTTLKEYLEITEAKVKYIDIYVWNEDRYDYDDLFGYESNTIEEVLECILNEDDYFCDREYLDYEVRHVEIEIDDGDICFRIEIQKGE